MKFREHILKSGKTIFLGRDAKNNDELVSSASEKDVLLHTVSPGSPFCNVGEEPTTTDIKEAAVVCARYSQDWRDNKKNLIIHKFLKSDTSKKRLKTGTWHVKHFKEIEVRKGDILNFVNETN